ncbi:MAG: T9SS type A sorting domain-containing protein [Bacteroidetes bacterium]|nr:T9SS type A sorting domain-containing protein [Bacteroidota bacterium]
MKKIYFAIAATLTLFGSLSAQVNTIVTAPSTSSANATTGNRAPNGTTNHTVMRGIFHVPAAELATLTSTITSFGFVLSNGVNATAGGSLTVYLMNTAATSYTLGTSWSTATTGVTQVFSGVYNIPVTSSPTVADFSFGSNFTYAAGSNLIVAYEYTGGLFASAPAIYTAYNSGAVAGASSATTAAPGNNTLTTTAFRPLYRFGTPNSYTNEISVSNLKAAGKAANVNGAAQSITADIMNGSNQSLTNIGVGLGISGANSYTGTVIIPVLAAGQVTTVTFPAYTPTAFGLSNMTVSVLPDQNPTNNTATWTQSVTCNTWAANPPVGSYTSAVGNGTNSILVLNKFTVPTAATLTAANIAISTNSATPGNAVYVALLNAAGSIVATSQTVTITAGMLGTFVPFTFTAQTLVSNAAYYVGLAQTQNSVAYSPYGTQAAASVPSIYYSAPITGGTVTPLNQNLGFFGIEVQFAGACGSVGLRELTASSAVQLYPNPTLNGKTTVAGLEGTNVITVYNILGQTVSTQTTDKDVVTVDLSNQISGTYLVRITNSDNLTKTIKVINQ